MFLGIGGTLMALPISFQHRLPGFLPVFLAWMIKSLVLYVGVMLSLLADWLWFNGAGHQRQSW